MAGLGLAELDWAGLGRLGRADWAGQDRTGQEGYVRTGQDRTGFMFMIFRRVNII